MLQPLIQLNQVAFSYNRTPILENISLNIRPGGFYGIIGPNGASKTTLMNILSGILKPGQGDILFKGQAMMKYSPKELAQNIAVVPQEAMINFPFTALEVVMMGRNPFLNKFQGMSSQDIDIVLNCMELCKVTELANRPVTHLSGGERQRVIFARALAQLPKLLLLDEATAHLDICHKLELLSLVRKLNREEGLTVVAVMHDLNLAAAFCPELICMLDGKIFINDKTERVLTSQIIAEAFQVEALIEKNSFGQLQVNLAPKN